MGYYTRYELEIVEGNDNVTNYEEEISELYGYGSCFEDSIKWYRHIEDMKKYSLKHPKTLFKLIGEGEEAGDLWVEYYLNGKIQQVKAKIIYDDFDSSKLV